MVKLKMNKLKAIQVLQDPKYFALMLISSFAIMIGFPAIQVKITGGFHNLDLWFATIPKFNLFMFVIFSILFGIMLSLQVYNFRLKTCDIKAKVTAGSSGSIASLIAVLVPACPACISLATLFLPTSVALSFGQFLVEFNVWLLLLSIGLMLGGIYLLGGFKKEL